MKTLNTVLDWLDVILIALVIGIVVLAALAITIELFVVEVRNAFRRRFRKNQNPGADEK